MNTFINQFIEILANNDCQEILNGDVNRSAMHSYELNGKSSPMELRKYLEKHFQQFKREYLAVEQDNEENAYSDILASLNYILANFTPAYKDVMESNNSSLKELFNVKLSVLQRINEFISLNPTSAENNSKETVYYFTVKNEFSGKYSIDICLNKLHSTLKDDFKYINCTTVQFKNLFKPVGNTKTKTPTPIVWLSAYSHLAYFIKCLVNAGFIPNTKQPSFNQIAKMLFYDNEEGKYFKISSVKSDVKNPFKSPYNEIKSKVNGILKN